MPRGRHRHSPPLHRLLPPTAIAGVSLVCALTPWVFEQPSVLRVSAAVAAATAAVGAAVMRRWDVEAGKRVADLTRARASDEWRHEERVAELETDLEESRELRTKLEHKLRAKRAELANLRNEHAALLRRYATAETERASALEGRRLLEIETTVPEEGQSQGQGGARALSTGDAPTAAAQASPVAPQGLPAKGAPRVSRDRADDDVVDGSDEAVAASSESASASAEKDGSEANRSVPSVFSPAGSALFLRANSALDRIITRRGAVEEHSESGVEAEVEAEAETDVVVEAVEAVEAVEVAEVEESAPEAVEGESEDESGKEKSSKGGSAEDRSPKGDPDGPTGGGSRQVLPEEGEGEAVPVVTAEEDDPAGKPGAADGHEHAVAEPTPAPVEPVPAQSALPVLSSGRPEGHFTVPTAVAYVPAAPQRRPAVEGGFDFFGTQKEADTFEAVQNEDLADVVGQEALALHKAESEGRFKPIDEASRGIGQVIDLTAHDETEQIDLQGLRTAAS
ncbi:hypothetical protein [Streptomyces graminofaciens]|nr:hypothetical protein [Streptomyces graminofaciens]